MKAPKAVTTGIVFMALPACPLKCAWYGLLCSILCYRTYFILSCLCNCCFWLGMLFLFLFSFYILIHLSLSTDTAYKSNI